MNKLGSEGLIHSCGIVDVKQKADVYSAVGGCANQSDRIQSVHSGNGIAQQRCRRPLKQRRYHQGCKRIINALEGYIC